MQILSLVWLLYDNCLSKYFPDLVIKGIDGIAGSSFGGCNSLFNTGTELLVCRYHVVNYYF